MKKEPVVQGIYESKDAKVSVFAMRDMLFSGGQAIGETRIKRGQAIDVWVVVPVHAETKRFAPHYFYDVPADPKKSSSATVGIMVPEDWIE